MSTDTVHIELIKVLCNTQLSKEKKRTEAYTIMLVKTIKLYFQGFHCKEKLPVYSLKIVTVNMNALKKDK